MTGRHLVRCEALAGGPWVAEDVFTLECQGGNEDRHRATTRNGLATITVTKNADGFLEGQLQPWGRSSPSSTTITLVDTVTFRAPILTSKPMPIEAAAKHRFAPTKSVCCKLADGCWNFPVAAP